MEFGCFTTPFRAYIAGSFMQQFYNAEHVLVIIELHFLVKIMH